MRTKPLIPDQAIDTIYHCPENMPSRYDFQVGEPGWHNLDKRRRVKLNQDMEVKTDVTSLRCYIVIRKGNSSVRAMLSNGIYYFENLPRDYECYLVAYKILDDGRVMFRIKSINTNDNKVVLNHFQTGSPEEFRKKLEIVNR